MHISKERVELLNNFQNKYDIFFSDISLLNQAFIHTSYTNENNLNLFESYEKLEFLGDAVLKLAISDILYKHFIDFSEGELTNLRSEIVSDKNIATYAIKLNLKKLLILGKNEIKQKGKDKSSILACAFEALLGAIYLEYKENGYIKTKDFIEKNFKDEILSIKDNMIINPKSLLQEYTQSINCKLPSYKTIKEEGPAHNKTFFVTVTFENEIIGKGSAKTIKQAQQMAAEDALKRIKNEK